MRFSFDSEMKRKQLGKDQLKCNNVARIIRSRWTWRVEESRALHSVELKPRAHAFSASPATAADV